MDPDVKVQKVTQVTYTDENGKAQPGLQYTFMVLTHGPFSERFPKNGFDPMVAKTALSTFATNLKQTLGASY
jgi:hypothetical protein